MKWNKVAAEIMYLIEVLQDEENALQSDAMYERWILTQNLEARHLVAWLLEGPHDYVRLESPDYDPDTDYDALLTDWCRNNKAYRLQKHCLRSHHRRGTLPTPAAAPAANSANGSTAKAPKPKESKPSTTTPGGSSRQRTGAAHK